MDILKIVGLGISATVFAVFIKRQRAELALLLSLLCGAAILIFSFPYLKTVITMFQDIASQVGFESGYIKLILKVIGIAYTAQFGAEICRDAGETSTASKIELAGKIIIMAISMPAVYSFIEVVSRMI